MITITGEPKEIAALVVALQEQQISVSFNCGKVNPPATEITSVLADQISRHFSSAHTP